MAVPSARCPLASFDAPPPLAVGCPVQYGRSPRLIDAETQKPRRERGRISNSSHRVLICVASPSPRAVARLEPGSKIRAMIKATTRSRSRLLRESKTRWRPSFSSVPRTAATCP